MDRGTIGEISSFAFDVLVIAALIGIKPRLVIMYALPLTVNVDIGVNIQSLASNVDGSESTVRCMV